MTRYFTYFPNIPAGRLSSLSLYILYTIPVYTHAPAVYPNLYLIYIPTLYYTYTRMVYGAKCTSSRSGHQLRITGPNEQAAPSCAHIGHKRASERESEPFLRSAQCGIIGLRKQCQQAIVARPRGGSTIAGYIYIYTPWQTIYIILRARTRLYRYIYTRRSCCCSRRRHICHAAFVSLLRIYVCALPRGPILCRSGTLSLGSTDNARAKHKKPTSRGSSLIQVLPRTHAHIEKRIPIYL